MGSVDVKRRGSNIPTGYVIPVKTTFTGTQTAAYTACLPVMPPTELYGIAGFDISWFSTSNITEQNSIEVGMMSLASANNIETTAILNYTGGAWAISSCTAIGSSSGMLYTVRARRQATSASMAAPWNQMASRSGTMVFTSGQTTVTTTSAGTAYTTSSTYDFRIASGGEVFSVLTADSRVKGTAAGARLGYIPAARITSANKTDTFKEVNFTVYFTVESLIGNAS